jgi:hypothetical protein
MSGFVSSPPALMVDRPAPHEARTSGGLATELAPSRDKPGSEETSSKYAALASIASEMIGRRELATPLPHSIEIRTSIQIRVQTRRFVVEMTIERTPNGFDDMDPAFTERVRINQRKLAAELKSRYDFIVCGSGSSGSVVARRLAENPQVSVLLLEAGGSDDVPCVMEAAQWPLNLGSERDWGFKDHPNPSLNGRSIDLGMGKVLGGGSSINVMAWARGHKNDWDFFA